MLCWKICTITYFYWTPSTPLDQCLTSILSSPQHSHSPEHAIIVVPYSSTEATGRHTCSKVCSALQYAVSQSTYKHHQHFLITASNPSFLRHSTPIPLTMLLWSYLLQAQKPQDVILDAKYVRLENLHHHLSLLNTLQNPLISAQIHIFCQSIATPLNMPKLPYLLQAQKSQDVILVAKYDGLENLHHHNPLLNTLHTSWSLPHIQPFFATALPHCWSCYYCRTCFKHRSHRTAYL